MRPSEKAQAAYLEALAALLARIGAAIGELPKELRPVRMFIAGGAAMHCYTGARVSLDVDAVYSHRISLPQDLAVAWRDADGKARYLYLDTQYNDTLGPLHEDAHADAVRLKLPGVVTRNLEPRLLAPNDLAISKLGRFSPVDRSDIEALAREGLLKVRVFRVRAQSALGGFVGNTERLAGTIDIACRLIEACQPRET